jgi:hypothetical protein
VIMMAVVVPTRAVSDELIVRELVLKLNQLGSGDAAQVMFIVIPEGFVTIDGKKRLIGEPI